MLVDQTRTRTPWLSIVQEWNLCRSRAKKEIGKGNRKTKVKTKLKSELG